MQKTVGKIHAALQVIFSLGLVVSLMVLEVDAAQLGLVDRYVDQSGTDDGVNFQGPRLQWPRNASRYLTANEQKAQTNGSRRREQKNEPATQERDTDGPTSSGPVGVAPEKKQELLPSWMVRTFDLPGAGVLTPKGTLIVEPYLQFAHLSSSRVTLTRVYYRSGHHGRSD